MSVTRYCQAGHKFVIDGEMEVGKTITVTATPAEGYTFVSWDDGSTSPTRTITIESCGVTYTAKFSGSGPTPPPTPSSYTISASANPSAGGSVSGGGTYNSGQTATLTATPNSNYTFVNWTKNGSEVSQRSSFSFTVTASGSYVANFRSNETPTYTITTNVSPAGSGTVSGGGQYASGATATLVATPASGYTFSRWSDGNTSISRNVTVSGNATYTAIFTQNSTQFWWKSSNNINDLRVPLSQYNAGTYTSTPKTVTAGAEGTSTGFGKYTAFVVPSGKSVSGIWTDALGGSANISFSSSYGCYATDVRSGYTCFGGSISGTPNGYRSANFTIQ